MSERSERINRVSASEPVDSRGRPDFRQRAADVAAEIGAVLDRVDAGQVTAVVNEVTAARRVHIIGVGREGLASRAFAMRLMHAGIDARWEWDDTTPAIGPGDVLIAVSGSGEIGHIDYVATRAVSHRARLVVVTANPQGVTAQRADVVLVVPGAAYGAGDDVVASIQPMGSLFEQCLLATFDLILLEVVATLGIRLGDLAYRHRNVE